MNIPPLGGSPAFKVDLETAIGTNESSRTDNKFVDKALTQADGKEQRIESRIAAVKQQVSSTTETSDSNASRKTQVSSSLSYALTNIAISDKPDSSNSEESQQNAEDANRQSRSASTQPVDQGTVALQKEHIQF